jgi:SAM-dependent methyltransferase
MIFANATVERTCAETGGSPLLECAAFPATVAGLVQLALAHPHLRRIYSSTEAVILELLDLDAAGRVRLVPQSDGKALRAYYENGETGADRSLDYVATYERNWQELRSYYDFVEAGDANAARKAFQRDVYLRHLGPHLDRLAPRANVLDAGCGVGRLTDPLLARRLRVTCADASAEALKCAVRVGLRGGGTLESLDARLCDVRDLACFADGEFAATIALEVICYQDRPLASLKELVRVTAPGGLVAVSVEGLHGSAIADSKLGPRERISMLDTAAVDIEDLLCVRYFTKRGLRALLGSAGLEAIELVGTHYTADGVFDRVATDAALCDERERRGLFAIEQAAAADPVLEPLARAWLATARVPGGGR